MVTCAGVLRFYRKRGCSHLLSVAKTLREVSIGDRKLGARDDGRTG